jgi:chemotaxis protein MotB
VDKQKKIKLDDPFSEGEDHHGDEINTVYGDLVTFIMMLFILLFVLSYNEKQNDDFFTQMNVKFGGKEQQQQHSITTDSVLVSQLQNFIEQEKLEEYMQILVDEQKIKLMLAPSLLFDSGKADIKSGGFKALNGVSKILEGVDNPVIIEGHTDNIPIRTAKYESNWDLSMYRALSVLKYFLNKGHDPRQLSAQGFGEYRPVSPNTTVDGRARNRRIEVNIIRITERS